MLLKNYVDQTGNENGITWDGETQKYKNFEKNEKYIQKNVH